MKNILFLIGLACLSMAGCKVAVHADPIPLPPVYDPYPEPLPPINVFQTCTITYDYYKNVAPGAIQPFVKCSARDADSNVNVSCYMEFRAGNLPFVTDRLSKMTDFFGDVDITISNGNCYAGEFVTLYAECVVNGQKLSSLDTGAMKCGR